MEMPEQRSHRQLVNGSVFHLTRTRFSKNFVARFTYIYMQCAFSLQYQKTWQYWSVVLGGACSLHFSTDPTLPYCLSWSMVPTYVVFQTPPDI